MKDTKESFQIIRGQSNGLRISSRELEERIQNAVSEGARNIEVEVYGQHGIGGRLWVAGDEAVHVRVQGNSGQRAGSLGFPNTFIEILGPASDDVGWLNAGAEILVKGNAASGAANGMAQGKIWVDGSVGARAMTMTKQNPRFNPPELWVLGGVGDYFGEFMAGGVAVICGHEPQDPENVLGYRPMVGMVGGAVYFRGPHLGYSEADAIEVPITETDWEWLSENLSLFLNKIDRVHFLEELSEKSQWRRLRAKNPQERSAKTSLSMARFRGEVWDAELGRGGLIGDLTNIERDPIPLIVTGDMRRFVPHWENRRFLSPCQAQCPTGMPVNDRWRFIREGRVDEAVELALAYTPFPATVCGYLCPNPCMAACTRKSGRMTPLDITILGKASIEAPLPPVADPTGKRIAIVGGGPAGISVAWQLRQKGHEAVIFDTEDKIGGKLTGVIPESRIPKEVLDAELERVRKTIPHVHLTHRVASEDVLRWKNDYDYLVMAVGAQAPRTLPIPGREHLVTALDFLKQAKTGSIDPGHRVVIIGAGNVGCDVATEAHRLGARDITLIDIQEPASFGKERQEAEAAGARFLWPRFSKEITAEGVLLTDGELLPADTVVVSIGDAPVLDFLPDSVETQGGFVKVNEEFQTSDPSIFAIGDAVKPGLLTDAIGAGRKAANAISRLLEGKTAERRSIEAIDIRRVKLEYFDPRITSFDSLGQCGSQCASCGACRDCGICVTACPRGAISRVEKPNSDFTYEVDGDKCIGCGFCSGVCPCGIWALRENEPID